MKGKASEGIHASLFLSLLVANPLLWRSGLGSTEHRKGHRTHGYQLAGDKGAPGVAAPRLSGLENGPGPGGTTAGGEGTGQELPWKWMEFEERTRDSYLRVERT